MASRKEVFEPTEMLVQKGIMFEDLWFVRYHLPHFWLKHGYIEAYLTRIFYEHGGLKKEGSLVSLFS